MKKNAKQGNDVLSPVATGPVTQPQVRPSYEVPSAKRSRVERSPDHVSKGIGANFFVRTPSLRFKDPDIWCHVNANFEVDGTAGVGEFFFHKRYSNADGTIDTLRCAKHKTPGIHCKVTAKVKPSGEIVAAGGTHNQLPDREGYGAQYRTTRNAILEDIDENPHVQPCDAILKKRRRLRRGPASQFVVERLLRTCRRVASRKRPKNVRSIFELHVEIQTKDIPGFTRSLNGEQRLLSWYNAELKIVLFTTKDLLELLADASMVHADATYEVVPKLASQLFTIHGNWEGYVGIVACALMQSSDSEAYEWIFRTLKGAVPNLVVRHFMADWDAAIRRAVNKEFPEAELHGCLFHFAQSLVRKIASPSIGLAAEIKKPGKPSPVFKMFLRFSALPLLPSEKIQATFEELCVMSTAVHSAFEKFTAYFRKYWMTTIGPGGLTVYRLLARTNNAVESNNAALKRRLRRRAPVWSLVGVIMDMSVDVTQDHQIHQSGVRSIRSRPSRATKRNEANISESWRKLENGKLSAMAFIDRVKYRVGASAMRRGLLKDEPADADAERAQAEDQNSVKLFEDATSEAQSREALIYSEDEDLLQGEATTEEDSPISSGDDSCSCSSCNDEEDSAAGDRCYSPQCGSDDDTDTASEGCHYSNGTDPSNQAACNPRVVSEDHTKAAVHTAMKKLQIPSDSKHMLAEIDEASEGPSEEILIKINNYAITRNDLRTLEGTNWLNDVIVNAYLSLIVQRNKRNSRLPKAFAFDTFFLKFLERDGPRSKSVRNWTRGENILAYDVILVPVHTSCHWSMVAIEVRAKDIRYMDSKANKNDNCLRLLRDYLANKVAEDINGAVNPDEWKLTHVIKKPQQANGYDCGVFALKYADFTSRQAKLNFTEKDMRSFRRRMSLEILKSSLEVAC